MLIVVDNGIERVKCRVGLKQLKHLIHKRKCPLDAFLSPYNTEFVSFDFCRMLPLKLPALLAVVLLKGNSIQFMFKTSFLSLPHTAVVVAIVLRVDF